MLPTSDGGGMRGRARDSDTYTNSHIGAAGCPEVSLMNEMN